MVNFIEIDNFNEKYELLKNHDYLLKVEGNSIKLEEKPHWFIWFFQKFFSSSHRINESSPLVNKLQDLKKKIEAEKFSLGYIQRVEKFDKIINDILKKIEDKKLEKTSEKDKVAELFKKIYLPSKVEEQAEPKIQVVQDTVIKDTVIKDTVIQDTVELTNSVANEQLAKIEEKIASTRQANRDEIKSAVTTIHQKIEGYERELAFKEDFEAITSGVQEIEQFLAGEDFDYESSKGKAEAISNSIERYKKNIEARDQKKRSIEDILTAATGLRDQQKEQLTSELAKSVTNEQLAMLEEKIASTRQANRDELKSVVTTIHQKIEGYERELAFKEDFEAITSGVQEIEQFLAGEDFDYESSKGKAEAISNSIERYKKNIEARDQKKRGIEGILTAATGLRDQQKEQLTSELAKSVTNEQLAKVEVKIASTRQANKELEEESLKQKIALEKEIINKKVELNNSVISDASLLEEQKNQLANELSSMNTLDEIATIKQKSLTLKLNNQKTLLDNLSDIRSLLEPLVQSLSYRDDYDSIVIKLHETHEQLNFDNFDFNKVKNSIGNLSSGIESLRLKIDNLNTMKLELKEKIVRLSNPFKDICTSIIENLTTKEDETSLSNFHRLTDYYNDIKKIKDNNQEFINEHADLKLVFDSILEKIPTDNDFEARISYANQLIDSKKSFLQDRNSLSRKIEEDVTLYDFQKDYLTKKTKAIEDKSELNELESEFTQIKIKYTNDLETYISDAEKFIDTSKDVYTYIDFSKLSDYTLKLRNSILELNNKAIDDVKQKITNEIKRLEKLANFLKISIPYEKSQSYLERIKDLKDINAPLWFVTVKYPDQVLYLLKDNTTINEEFDKLSNEEKFNFLDKNYLVNEDLLTYLENYQKNINSLKSFEYKPNVEITGQIKDLIMSYNSKLENMIGQYKLKFDAPGLDSAVRAVSEERIKLENEIRMNKIMEKLFESFQHLPENFQKGCEKLFKTITPDTLNDVSSKIKLLIEYSSDLSKIYNSNKDIIERNNGNTEIKKLFKDVNNPKVKFNEMSGNITKLNNLIKLMSSVVFSIDIAGYLTRADKNHLLNQLNTQSDIGNVQKRMQELQEANRTNHQTFIKQANVFAQDAKKLYDLGELSQYKNSVTSIYDKDKKYDFELYYRSLVDHLSLYSTSLSGDQTVYEVQPIKEHASAVLETLKNLMEKQVEHLSCEENIKIELKSKIQAGTALENLVEAETTIKVAHYTSIAENFVKLTSANFEDLINKAFLAGLKPDKFWGLLKIDNSYFISIDGVRKKIDMTPEGLRFSENKQLLSSMPSEKLLTNKKLNEISQFTIKREYLLKKVDGIYKIYNLKDDFFKNELRNVINQVNDYENVLNLESKIDEKIVGYLDRYLNSRILVFERLKDKNIPFLEGFVDNITKAMQSPMSYTDKLKNLQELNKIIDNLEKYSVTYQECYNSAAQLGLEKKLLGQITSFKKKDRFTLDEVLTKVKRIKQLIEQKKSF